METQMDCYGTMFPDLDRLDINKPLAGKVFEVLVESRGIGVSSRQVAVWPEGWDECTACENHRDCYDLSMAKLALTTALAGRT
jgi:hypothetical protein